MFTSKYFSSKIHSFSVSLLLHVRVTWQVGPEFCVWAGLLNQQETGLTAEDDQSEKRITNWGICFLKKNIGV